MGILFAPSLRVPVISSLTLAVDVDELVEVSFTVARSNVSSTEWPAEIFFLQPLCSVNRAYILLDDDLSEFELSDSPGL